MERKHPKDLQSRLTRQHQGDVSQPRIVDALGNLISSFDLIFIAKSVIVRKSKAHDDRENPRQMELENIAAKLFIADRSAF